MAENDIVNNIPAENEPEENAAAACLPERKKYSIPIS